MNSMLSKFNQISNFPIHLTPLSPAEMTCMPAGLSNIMSLWGCIKRTIRIVVRGPSSWCFHADIHWNAFHFHPSLCLGICLHWYLWRRHISIWQAGTGPHTASSWMILKLILSMELLHPSEDQRNFLTLSKSSNLEVGGHTSPSVLYLLFLCESPCVWGHKKVSCLLMQTRRHGTQNGL